MMDTALVIGLIGVYLLPSLIVAVRRPSMTLVVIVLNILLGWTIVGWSVSLALAMLLPGAGTAQVPPVVPAVSACRLQPNGTAHELDFLMDPVRVSALSVVAPVIYPYWWLWRFFQFAKRQQFPRARSFWWVFVPFYGWAIIGRLFHDLEARLGPSRPAGFNAQVAVAMVVAANVSAGWSLRLPSRLALVGLAMNCIFITVAIYQVQTAVNAYLRATYPGGRGVQISPVEIMAVTCGLLLLGVVVLGGLPNVRSGTAYSFGGASSRRPLPVVAPTHSPIASPGATPSATSPSVPQMQNVFSFTSEPGDYIGQGRSVLMTPPSGRFLANLTPGGVSIMIDSSETRWVVDLAAPRGQPLRMGTYVNAERAAFRNGSAPGIDVFGDGRGCNQVFGSFSVTRVDVDAQGNVQAFEATFVQHCESPTAPALRGTVRYAAGG